MASPITILRRTAMMENCKVSTASSEYRRRWKNSSKASSKESFEQITQEFTDALHGMGYSEEWVERVLLGAAKG